MDSQPERSIRNCEWMKNISVYSIIIIVRGIKYLKINLLIGFRILRLAEAMPHLLINKK